MKHRTGVTVLGDAHHLHLLMPDGTLVACPPKGHMTASDTGRTAQAAA